MSPSERFAAIMADPSPRLDEAMFAIAAHDHPVKIADGLATLDVIASAVAEPSLDALRRQVFGTLAFRGDTTSYHHPCNSFLDRVIERRLGMPITLSVLLIEVGRRCGVMLDGVGLPGHFVVRDRSEEPVFVDAFNGGGLLDVAGCQALVARLGAAVEWHDEFVEPVAPERVVARVLANLHSSFRRRHERLGGLWTAQLMTLIPGSGPQEELLAVGASADAGRYDEAAHAAEALASDLDGEAADKIRHAASRYRAKLN